MNKFTEEKLEQAIIALLEQQGYSYHRGDSLARGPAEVLLKDDLRAFLSIRYASDGITEARSTRLYASWMPTPPLTFTTPTRPSTSWWPMAFCSSARTAARRICTSS